jgi:hypothetical protein
MKEHMQTEPPENFDNMHLSGANALSQLKVIEQCLQNFKLLSQSLNSKDKIRDGV